MAADGDDAAALRHANFALRLQMEQLVADKHALERAAAEGERYKADCARYLVQLQEMQDALSAANHRIVRLSEHAKRVELQRLVDQDAAAESMRRATTEHRAALAESKARELAHVRTVSQLQLLLEHLAHNPIDVIGVSRTQQASSTTAPATAPAQPPSDAPPAQFSADELLAASARRVARRPAADSAALDRAAAPHAASNEPVDEDSRERLALGDYGARVDELAPRVLRLMDAWRDGSLTRSTPEQRSLLGEQHARLLGMCAAAEAESNETRKQLEQVSQELADACSERDRLRSELLTERQRIRHVQAEFDDAQRRLRMTQAQISAYEESMQASLGAGDGAHARSALAAATQRAGEYLNALRAAETLAAAAVTESRSAVAATLSLAGGGGSGGSSASTGVTPAKRGVVE